MRYFLSMIYVSFFCMAQAQAPITLPLQKKYETVGSNERVPVIIKGSEDQVDAFLNEIGRKKQYRFGNFTRSDLSYSEVENAKDFDLQIAGGIKGQILNDSVRVLNHAVQLHNGEGLSQAYKGKGVIVGILDSGLDYRHNDFNDENGDSRIYAIWDQRRQGSPPQGYSYGLLCDSLSIAQGTCETYDQDWTTNVSHGTHVAGTAAGFDQTYDNLYTGMAPEATIIAVGLDFENFATSVIDGAKFIYDIAQEKGMPAVINLSAGSYTGPHDGKNLVTYALNDLITATDSRVFVASAGNGGTDYLHARHDIEPQPKFTYFSGIPDNLFEWTFFSDSLDFTNAEFQLQVDRKNTLEKLGNTAWLNILSDFEEPGNQIIEKQEVVLSESADTLGRIKFSVEKFEGRYGVRVQIDKTSNSYYWRLSTKGQGMLDIYSNRKLTRTSSMIRIESLPSDFEESSAYISPDLNQNTVGFFSASRNVITVGQYASNKFYTNYYGEERKNPNAYPTDLYYKSSNGPNRDGYLKPDIISTGAMVASAANQDFLQEIIAGNIYTNHINLIPPDGEHIHYSGTSMSSPSVAGGVALLLQRYPDLSWREVMESVWANAYKDEHTSEEPDNRWGYGKFSAYNAVQNVVKYGCTDSAADNYDSNATISENETCVYSGCTNPRALNYSMIATIDDGSCLLPDEGESFYFKITPNPVTDFSEITYGLPTNGEAEITIHNAMGQLIWSTSVYDKVGNIALNKNELSFSSQIYFISLIQDGKVLKTKQVIVQ